MSYKLTFALLTLTMVGIAVGSYVYLPDEIPIHYNLRGEPDAWGHKGNIFILPGILITQFIFVPLMLKLSPKKYQAGESTAAINQILAAVGILFICIQLSTIARPLQWGLHPNTFNSLGFAAFMIFGGNVLGRVEKNFFIGIRVPWTLTSDSNWRATHRLAGKLLVVGGLVLAMISFWVENMMWPVSLLLAGLLYPVYYSYRYYAKHEKPLEV